MIVTDEERFELADVRLFITTDFDCSRSGSFRTVLGVRLCLLFAMECGLQLPWRKHYSVLDFLTSSAFFVPYLSCFLDWGRECARGPFISPLTPPRGAQE